MTIRFATDAGAQQKEEERKRKRATAVGARVGGAKTMKSDLLEKWKKVKAEVQGDGDDEDDADEDALKRLSARKQVRPLAPRTRLKCASKSESLGSGHR